MDTNKKGSKKKDPKKPKKFTMNDLNHFAITGELQLTEEDDNAEYDAVIEFINEWLGTNKKNYIDSLSQFRNISETQMDNKKQRSVAKQWIPTFRKIFELRGPLERNCTKIFRKVLYKLRYSLYYNIIDREKIFHVIPMKESYKHKYEYSDYIREKIGFDHKLSREYQYAEYVKEKLLKNQSPENDSSDESEDESEDELDKRIDSD